jgi:hypothetical protein
MEWCSGGVTARWNGNGKGLLVGFITPSIHDSLSLI